MPKESDGIPSLGIIAMIATMFPEMSIVNRAMAAMYAEKSGFEVDQGRGLPVVLVQEPIYIQATKMKIDGGGPEPVEIQKVFEMMVATAVEEDQGQGGGVEHFDTRTTIQHVLHGLPDIEVCQTGKDPGGGLPEAQVVIPGTIMKEISGDKNHRYAGFDVRHQLFPAMEQEYFGMKTKVWQGSKLKTSTQQSHHLATEISNPMTGFGS